MIIVQDLQLKRTTFLDDDEYDPQSEIRSIGITVNESCDNLNIIYRNTFNRLHIGILAQIAIGEQTIKLD